MKKESSREAGRRTTSSSRYGQLSEAFLKYLVANLVGFRQESPKVQRNLAKMILESPARFRAHSHYKGHSTFSSLHLDEKFGRGQFARINARLDIFDHAADEQGRPGWSLKSGYTKGYRLSKSMQSLLEKFLLGNNRRTTRLLNEEGELSPVPRNALASKRKDGQTKAGFKDPVVTEVPVNLAMLKKLITHLEGLLFSLENGYYQGSLLHPEPDADHLNALLFEARHILGLARNEQSPNNLIHRYEQSDSGRWYAVDTNFQNTYRVIRKACMAGLWDYDIENCHYSILEQVARNFGYECREIRRYLENKSRVRADLAERFGMTIDQAKQALIALVYGAHRSFRVDEEGEPVDAIGRIVGDIHRTRLLFDHPTFRGLEQDISGARDAILNGWPVTRQTIRNDMGLTMSVKEADKRQLLAHILQGIEAKALEAMHQLYPTDIVLLQHDGFTASRPLDIDALERAVLERTGYRLEVATDGPIVVDLDSDLAKHPVKNHLKSGGRPDAIGVLARSV